MHKRTSGPAIIPGIEWRYQKGMGRPPQPVWTCIVCDEPFDDTDSRNGTVALVFETETGCRRHMAHNQCSGDWSSLAQEQIGLF